MDYCEVISLHIALCVDIYIYKHISWVQVTPDVILKNVTPQNNLLLNLYFENPTIGLHVLYSLNMHANFHANRM